MINTKKDQEIQESQTVNKYGFPLEVCGRCHGTGNYSYNEIDGTTCYGCSGSGFKITKRAEKAYAAFRTAYKEAQRPLVKNLQVGDYIAQKNVWCRVARITKTDEVSGCSVVDGVECNFTYRYEVEFDNSKVRTYAENELVKRKATLDSTPFLALIKSTKKSKVQ